jgi:rubrerythrin
MAEHSVFTAARLMDMAVRIEEQGRAFYEACLSEPVDDRSRALFQYLLDQERQHARLFARMREGLEEEPLPESYPGELQSYMEAFTGGAVFDDPARAPERARELRGPGEVLEAALDFEKRSILYYSGMKNLVRPSDADQVDRVMAEEHDHVRRLLALRREATDGREE